jgi:hypothetical protein
MERRRSELDEVRYAAGGCMLELLNVLTEGDRRLLNCWFCSWCDESMGGGCWGCGGKTLEDVVREREWP